jgi:biotin operon repressor
MVVAVREREQTDAKKKRERRASRRNGKDGGEFSILSAQGRVLFYIAVCPDSPVQEIASSLDLTERAVWGVVRELRQSSMIHLRKKGRRHYYAINLEAPLLHPTIRGLTLRPILGEISARTKRDRPEVCD